MLFGGFILYNNYIHIKLIQNIACYDICWLFCTFYVKKYMLEMCKAVYQRRLVKASNLKKKYYELILKLFEFTRTCVHVQVCLFYNFVKN